MAGDPLSILDLAAKKDRGEPIVMLTAYDYPTARLADAAGADVILVGDSLGMVALGYESTVPVTLEEMIHHTRAARRGCQRALLVGDLPFLSYQVSPEQAVTSAGRLVKEGGATAVKLEGGREQLPAVSAIVRAGIPVMGHLGLTPQTASLAGGYRVQGREAASARRLLEEASLLEEVGVFALVIECVPRELAGLVRRRLRIPVIGIGAGPDCDGQVLVLSDVLGLFDRFLPRFVERYADLAKIAVEALAAFTRDVREARFPAERHTFTMPAEEWEKLLRELDAERQPAGGLDARPDVDRRGTEEAS